MTTVGPPRHPDGRFAEQPEVGLARRLNAALRESFGTDGTPPASDEDRLAQQAEVVDLLPVSVTPGTPELIRVRDDGGQAFTDRDGHLWTVEPEGSPILAGDIDNLDDFDAWMGWVDSQPSEVPEPNLDGMTLDDVAVHAGDEVNAAAGVVSLGKSAPAELYAAALDLLASVEVKDATWNPRLHPRDKDGRFIDVGGIVDLLGSLGGGSATVVGNGPNNRITVRKPDGSEMDVPANQVVNHGAPKVNIGKPGAVGKPGKPGAVGKPVATPAVTPGTPNAPAAPNGPSPLAEAHTPDQARGALNEVAKAAHAHGGGQDPTAMGALVAIGLIDHPGDAQAAAARIEKGTTPEQAAKADAGIAELPHLADQLPKDATTTDGANLGERLRQYAADYHAARTGATNEPNQPGPNAGPNPPQPEPGPKPEPAGQPATPGPDTGTTPGQPAQGDQNPTPDLGRNVGPAAGGGRAGRPSDTSRSGLPQGVQLDLGGQPVQLPAADLQRIKDKGLTPKPVYKIVSDAAGAQAFHDAIQASKEGHPHGAAVHVYSPEEYQGMQLFLAEGGKAGAAVKDGEAVSLFNNDPEFKGAVNTLLPVQIQAGATTLDAFNTVLPKMYAEFGFRPVARLPFDDKYAPDGWDKATFKDFNNGSPDVYFMALQPGRPLDMNPDSIPVAKDYDAGVQAAKDVAVPQPKAPDDYVKSALRGISRQGSPTGAGTEADPIDVGNDVEKALALLAEGKHVRLNQPDQVATLVDRIADEVKKAKAEGGAAAVFDLCKVTVPGTNLFCAEHQGISRAQMPQLSGKPIPGSPADAMSRGPSGNVDLTDPFIAALRDQGISVADTSMPISHLRASQREIDGQKVSGMVQAARAGKIPNWDAPIFVTRDGYVIDGHHRWAAKAIMDTEDGILGNEPMNVRKVDMDVGAALDFTNAYVAKMGIPPAGLTDRPHEMVPGITPSAKKVPHTPGPTGDMAADSERVLALQKKYGEAGADTESTYDKLEGEAGLWTAMRRAVHESIINDFLNRPGIKSEGKMLVMSGLPGAGKTTFLNSPEGQKRLGINLDHYVLINPDEIKQAMIDRGLLPHWDGLTADEAASLYHEESSIVSKMLMERALAEGKNVVLDTTVKKPDQLTGPIRAAREAGKHYDQTLLFVDVPIDTALERATYRYQQGGRFVPLSFIESLRMPPDSPYASKNAETFDQLKGLAERWVHVDNSNADGNGPRVVADSLDIKPTETPEVTAAMNRYNVDLATAARIVALRNQIDQTSVDTLRTELRAQLLDLLGA